jgi:hypothetical protein
MPRDAGLGRGGTRGGPLHGAATAPPRKPCRTPFLGSARWSASSGNRGRRTGRASGASTPSSSCGAPGGRASTARAHAGSGRTSGARTLPGSRRRRRCRSGHVRRSPLACSASRGMSAAWSARCAVCRTRCARSVLPNRWIAGRRCAASSPGRCAGGSARRRGKPARRVRRWPRHGRSTGRSTRRRTSHTCAPFSNGSTWNASADSVRKHLTRWCATRVERLIPNGCSPR